MSAPDNLPTTRSHTALLLFRKACGLMGPIVLHSRDVERPGETTTAHQFDAPFVLIGRDRGADMTLSDARVSRRHAILQAIGGRLFCLDLQSRIQLHWENDDEPRTKGWLVPGQGLRIGPFRILSQALTGPVGSEDRAGDPTMPEAADLGDQPDVPGLRLELPIRWGGTETCWRMDSLIAVAGRSDACQLVLSDESISKLHAYFIRTPAGLWVVDLFGRQGVVVNGHEVRWAWLDEGDLVRIGQFGFKVRYDRPPDQISRAEVPLLAGATIGSGARPAVDQGRRPGKSLAIRPQAGGSVISNRTPTRSPATPVPRLLADSWEPAFELETRQRAMWQQQIQAMESFHNDMILMVQMFAALHRETLRSVRGELDSVRRLTEELGLLQKGLLEAAGDRKEAAHDSGPAPTDAPGTPSKPRREARGEGHGPRSRGRHEQPPGPGDGPVRPRKSRSMPGDDARRASPPETVDLAMHGDLCRRISQIQAERQGYWRKILGAMNK